MASGGRDRSQWLQGPWLYVLNRGGIQLLPLDLVYRLALPFGDLSYAIWRSKAETARRNFARLLKAPPDDPRAEKMARACFRQFSLYIAELIHVQGWDTEMVMDRLQINGQENFDEAESHRKGIIFVSAHMGSTEVAATLVSLRGYRITAVSEHIPFKTFRDWAFASRADRGITLLPAAGAGVKLIRALWRNEMVAMVVDIGVDREGGVPITFFGERTYFPSGPARLARITGAPVVFGLASRRPGGRFVAHVMPPIFADRSLSPEEDIPRLTQKIADIFEGFVRRYPVQWYPFRDMWPNDDGSGK